MLQFEAIPPATKDHTKTLTCSMPVVTLAWFFKRPSRSVVI